MNIQSPAQENAPRTFGNISLAQLLGGALTLRTDTFKNLRERSDVFYRGFVLLLLIGLLAGAFAVAVPFVTQALHPLSEQQVTAEAISGFEQFSIGPGVYQSMIESYIREGTAMVYEIMALPPNAGAAFRPFKQILDWVGGLLTTPFTFGFMGFLLLFGLLVHWTSRWLGGRAGMAQMLGLTALGWAPHILDPISSLLTLGGNLTGAALFGTLNTLLGWLLLVWGAVIYVKATAIAQEFSYGRSIGAVLLAIVLILLAIVLLSCIVGGLFAALIASLVPAGR